MQEVYDNGNTINANENGGIDTYSLQLAEYIDEVDGFVTNEEYKGKQDPDDVDLFLKLYKTKTGFEITSFSDDLTTNIFQRLYTSFVAGKFLISEQKNNGSFASSFSLQAEPFDTPTAGVSGVNWFFPKDELVNGNIVLRAVASREWTENLLEGLKTKQPVRVATTANITLSGTQTIDGVALSVDDRVLVKDNSTQSQNGMYLVKSGAWVRTDDANTATELTNAVVSVLEGTANSGATFRQITTSITLGSSNIVWQTYRDWETDRKSTRLNSSHSAKSRMPSSA